MNPYWDGTKWVYYPMYVGGYFPVYSYYPFQGNKEIPVKTEAWDKLSKKTKEAILKELGIF